MERRMKANFWMLIGVLAVFILFTSLANAGGKGGNNEPTILTIPTTLPIEAEGWWEVGMFGTSLSQNKERGVVSEDVWTFVNPSVCQETWCYSDIRVFEEDGWKWKEVGSGSLSLPLSGNSLWYNFYFYETGDNYYGSIFYFGKEMEGGFTSDKWECPTNESYCTLISQSAGRIKFKK